MLLFICNSSFIVIYCDNRNIDNKRTIILRVTSVIQIPTVTLVKMA